jgi:hypothetical protein
MILSTEKKIDFNVPTAKLMTNIRDLFCMMQGKCSRTKSMNVDVVVKEVYNNLWNINEFDVSYGLSTEECMWLKIILGKIGFNIKVAIIDGEDQSSHDYEEHIIDTGDVTNRLFSNQVLEYKCLPVRISKKEETGKPDHWPLKEKIYIKRFDEPESDPIELHCVVVALSGTRDAVRQFFRLKLEDQNKNWICYTQSKEEVVKSDIVFAGTRAGVALYMPRDEF